MVDALYDAAFPKGRRVGRELTYLERELGIMGRLERGIGVKHKLTITVSGETLVIECVCPWYPNTKALGCPLHATEALGGSRVVERLKAKMNRGQIPG